MDLIEKLYSWNLVRAELAARGIEWTVAKRMILSRTGFQKECHGVHVYIFNNDLEVAYWTPIMENLLIHDKPREWGDHLITEDYDYNEHKSTEI